MVLAEAGGITEVTTSVSNLMTFVGTLIRTIMGEPILAMMFVAGLVGVACGVIYKLKHV